jgi:hypothetical protein
MFGTTGVAADPGSLLGLVPSFPDSVARAEGPEETSGVSAPVASRTCLSLRVWRRKPGRIAKGLPFRERMNHAGTR